MPLVTFANVSDTSEDPWPVLVFTFDCLSLPFCGCPAKYFGDVGLLDFWGSLRLNGLICPLCGRGYVGGFGWLDVAELVHGFTHHCVQVKRQTCTFMCSQLWRFVHYVKRSTDILMYLINSWVWYIQNIIIVNETCYMHDPKLQVKYCLNLYFIPVLIYKMCCTIAIFAPSLFIQ